MVRAWASRLLVGCSTLGVPLQLRVSTTSLSLRPWLLAVASAPVVAGPSEAQDAQAVLPSLTSKAEPVVASGREMVVVSVPAEVTVILLDIEGTTTPIAFVKVRGGRKRGSYLCLKASEREILSVADFAQEAQERRCGFPSLEWGREAAAVCGGAFPRATIFSSVLPYLLSVRWRRIGRSGGGLSYGLGRDRSAGRSWGDWSAHGLAGRCVARWMSVHHVLKVAACRGGGLDLVVLEV